MGLNFVQNECGAVEAALPGSAREGSGEGAGRSASTAEPVAWQAPETAMECHLGAGPALRGPRHQGGDQKLGWRAAAPPAAPQVRENERVQCI